MHDAHLGRAFLFLDVLAEHTLLSMTAMFTPCLWYLVGMKLVMSYVKFSSSPFCTCPFWQMPNFGVPLALTSPHVKARCNGSGRACPGDSACQGVVAAAVRRVSKHFQCASRHVLFCASLRAFSLLGCTPRGSCNCTLPRRVLRRFSNSKCFLEGFLEGACKGFQ